MFCNVPFLFSVVFFFLQHEKTQNKKLLCFFENLVFHIAKILGNTRLATLLTICDFKHTPKHHKTEKNEQNQSWTRY